MTTARNAIERDGTGRLMTWHNDADEIEVIGRKGLSGVTESVRQSGKMAGARKLAKKCAVERWAYTGKVKKKHGQSV